MHLVEDDGELTQSSTSNMFKYKDSTIWDLLEDDTMRLAYGIMGMSLRKTYYLSSRTLTLSPLQQQSRILKPIVYWKEYIKS